MDFLKLKIFNKKLIKRRFDKFKSKLDKIKRRFDKIKINLKEEF
jgi:uncharacterized protein YydD (DUF2326 family)